MSKYSTHELKLITIHKLMDLDGQPLTVDDIFNTAFYIESTGYTINLVYNGEDIFEPEGDPIFEHGMEYSIFIRNDEIEHYENLAKKGMRMETINKLLDEV
mgnify:CR=1 FL=1|jgi:hypothetical protein